MCGAVLYTSNQTKQIQNQVCAGFVPENPVEGTAAEKQVAITDRRKRQTAWLQRERGPGMHQFQWRPRKRFRGSAEKWLYALDNQLKFCTAFGGLAFISPEKQPDMFLPSKWRRWPHMLCNLDQGSDGLSAVYASLFKFLLCMTPIFDWVHGCQRDFWHAYKQVGQYSTCLLFLIIFNLSQGPDKEEGLRFKQLQDALAEMAESFPDPESFPLFLEHSEQMLQELADVIDVNASASPIRALYEYITQSAPFTKKHYRVKLGEFGAWQTTAEAFLSAWGLTRFKCEYVALETDMIGTGKFAQKIIINKDHLKAADEATTTTSSTATQIDTKILRSCCQNVVVVSLAILGELQYKRILAVMALVVGPLRHWQGNCSKMMKSSNGNMEWLTQQFASEFMGVLVRAWKTLSSMKLMQTGGFLDFQHAAEEELDGISLVDDEFAGMQGKLTQHTIAARLRRLLYVFGPPPDFPLWKGLSREVQKGHVGSQEAL